MKIEIDESTVQLWAVLALILGVALCITWYNVNETNKLYSKPEAYTVDKAAR